MANGHLGLNFTLDDLKSEQVDIDKLVDSLLSRNCGNINSTAPLSPANLSQQRRKSSEIAATPIPVSVKRGPGRPKSNKSTVAEHIQPKSPSPLTEDSSLSAIIECINKINVQNKKLLNIVESVVSKVDCVSAPNKSTTTPDLELNEAPATSGVLTNVNTRLDKLEQNINQNVLIYRGQAVENLIKESEIDGKPSLERLKDDLCKSTCGEGATNINISEVRISIFGRAKKAVTVECPNLVSKIHILKKARERRPQNLYVNEFLTESKLKLFLNARSLKRLHPDKIKAVFTRSGNVCYTLTNSQRFHQINTISELEGALGQSSGQLG